MRRWRDAGGWFAYYGAISLAGVVWSFARIAYEEHALPGVWIADIVWGFISLLNAYGMRRNRMDRRRLEELIARQQELAAMVEERNNTL